MNWLLVADIALDVFDKYTDSLSKTKTGENKGFVVPDYFPVFLLIIVLVVSLIRKFISWLKSNNDVSVNTLEYQNRQINTPFEVSASISVSDVGVVDGKTIMRDTLKTDYIVTSPFSTTRNLNGHIGHKGTDLRAAVGTEIYSPFNGTVTRVYNSTKGLSGRYIDVLDNSGKLVVRVMHLSEILVKEGAKVNKGDLIAKSGASGKGKEKAYTPHIHFQLGTNNNGNYNWVDAEKWEPDEDEEVEVKDDTNITVHEAPVFDKVSHKGLGVAAKTKSPGNMTGRNPFDNGKVYVHPKTKLKFTCYDSWTQGYAGNGYRLLQYMSGQTRYMERNPTLRKLVRVWVGDSSEDELNKRALSAGISDVDKPLPIVFDVVLAILLAIGLWDSSHCVPEEAREGLHMAWSKWVSEGGKPDGIEGNILNKPTNVSYKRSVSMVNNETNRRQ